MPFTPAHTALVMPLKKLWPRYLSLTGLMAGAMAPDLVYFVQLTTISRGFGHSWSGLVIFCLPAAIAFSFAFHRLFKYHFIINLPSPFDRVLSGLAVSPFRVAGWKSWTTFAGSIVIGTLSHFFWDSFTHRHGEIAQLLPFLTEHTRLFGFDLLNARIAQHVSTVAGLLGLTLGLWKGGLVPRPVEGFEARDSLAKVRFWAGHGLVATAFAVLVVVFFARFFSGHPVGNATIFGLAGWSGFFYSVVTYTVVFRVMRLGVIFTDSR